VIESDDWGAIRTSSRENYNFLAAAGYPMGDSVLSVDALETEDDLTCLFDTLERFKDRRGRPACMTANMVMANPNFEKTREAEYAEYIYEPASETLKRHSCRERVGSLWKEGLSKRIFVPQFHAREHFRWWKWLEALRQNSKEAHVLFGVQMHSLPKEVSKTGICFDGPVCVTEAEMDHYKVDIAKVICDGINMFKAEFGGKPLSTISPSYYWTEQVERAWQNAGIKYIAGNFIQICGSTAVRRNHYTGQRNSWGGIYLVRNCNFEQNYKTTSRIKRCLQQINSAFRNHQPAILCSHRVNYIGSICEKNRTRGIQMLKTLLQEITKTWPDVIFLSVPELGYMIEHDIKRIDDFNTSPEDVLLPGRKQAEAVK